MNISHYPFCDKAELVCAYALQVLHASEVPAIQAHIAACPDCRRELENLRPVVDQFAAWPTDVLRPAASLQERLALRIAEETGKPPVTPPARQWPEPCWEQVAPGIKCKLLANDTQRHRVSVLLRLAPGACYPAHVGVEELYLLDGELWIDERKLVPGDYNHGTPGTGGERIWSETGCTCFLVTSTQGRSALANFSRHYACYAPMTTEKDTTWSYAQVATLWEQARRQASLHEIALVLAKSQATILQKARELGVPIDYMRPGSGEQQSRSSNPR